MEPTVRRIVAIAAVGLALAAGCGGDSHTLIIDPGDGGKYAPVLDPANFVALVDNDYFPLQPGSRWVYESVDGSERIEVEVLTETREVIGITATVVRDTVYEDGEVIEDTWDWYAQDKDGNVWYLGEDTAEYKDGKVVSHHGAWEAGVDGALPGIVMWADLAAGKAYRQEYFKSEAEDMARIERAGVNAAVRGVSYDGVVVIREWTPLDPGIVEDKYYAPGVGPILEIKIKGGDERLELVSFERGK